MRGPVGPSDQVRSELILELFFSYIFIAVCLDGSLPAYHLDRGSGSGANSWLIQLEVRQL